MQNEATAMANVATCPKCAKQLALPASAALTDRAECPECLAVFSLQETVQIALPVARVLGPDEQPLVAVSSAVGDLPSEAPPTTDDSHADGPLDCTAPLRSWEERLQQALARDDSDDAPAARTSATSHDKTAARPAREAGPTAEAAASDSPNFEFELDLRTPADLDKDRAIPRLSLPQSCLSDSPTAEPAAQPTHLPSQTLAEFAAAADIPAAIQESGIPNSGALNRATTAPPDGPIVIDEVSVAAKPTFDDFTLPDEPDDIVVHSNPRQVMAGRAVARIAAWTVGPAVGSLLGLYGLLWLQGAKADYLGLARVLPAAMLPAGLGGTSGDALLAKASLPAASLAAERLSDESSWDEESLAATESSPLAEHRELAPQPQGPPAALKRDGAVLPASAAQPVAPAGSTASTSPPAAGSLTTAPIAARLTAGISVEQFSALVDEAAAALPEFLAGDLATPKSTRSKGQAYVALCRLAEHFDFGQQPRLAPSVQAKASQAREIYHRLTSQANYRQELSHIAARWWGYPKRPNTGIFLTGQVERVQPVANETVCWVQLSEQAGVEAIPVLLQHQGYRTGDQIAVVGSVISGPSESLAGIGVSADQVVVAQYDYPLE